MSVIKVFALALGLVISVATAVLFEEHIISIGWHALHGHKATFQGHELDLPLMWRATRVDDSSAMFARARIFASTDKLLIVHPAELEVLGRPTQARYVRKQLQIGAKEAQFTCFLDEARDAADVSELVCVSKALDLNAFFRGDAEQMIEVNSILSCTK